MSEPNLSMEIGNVGGVALTSISSFQYMLPSATIHLNRLIGLFAYVQIPERCYEYIKSVTKKMRNTWTT